MTDYAVLFGTLGAEFKNQRKVEAVFEDFHLVSSSNYAKRLLQAAYAPTSDVYQEVALNLGSSTYEKSVAPNMQGLAQNLKQIFEQGWFPVLDSQINTNASDKQVGAIAYIYDPELTDGTISILSRLGRWGALRSKMIADGEVILKNAVTFGSLAANSLNLGTIALSSISGVDHALSGTLTLICIDDTVDSPKFSAVNVLTNKLADPAVLASTDGLFSLIQADNLITLGKSFQDGQLGLSTLLTLGAIAITDPSSIFTGFTPVMTNPTEVDTNKGKVYLVVTRQSDEPIWLVQWYRDAAFTELVTQGTCPSINGSIFMAGPGGTYLQLTLNLVNAAAAMPAAGNQISTVVVDIHTPRLNDQWTISVANAEGANFATKLAHLYRASLNSASAKPSAAPTAALAGAGAGNVNSGTHSYSFAYVVSGVETGASAGSNVVTTSGGNGKVDLTGITAGPSGTTARKIYRTIAGDTGSRKLVATISDNVTTTYQDNIADGSLGATALVQIDDTLATSVSMV